MFPLKMWSRANTRGGRPGQYSLYVYETGRNLRIGNMLPLLGMLISIAEETRRELVFPFLEKSVPRVFDWIGDPPRSLSELEIGALQSLFDMAEESIAAQQGVGRNDYTPGRVYIRDFPFLKTRTIIGRNSLTSPGIDWRQPIEDGSFAYSGDVILGRAYRCFGFQGASERDPVLLDKNLYRLKDKLQVNPGLRRNIETKMGLNAVSGVSEKLDICFHWRQGDYAEVFNGKYQYSKELVDALLGNIADIFGRINRSIDITLVTDEKANSAGDLQDRCLFSGTFEEEFLRLAYADIVFSNFSSFSAVAASCGRVFCGRKNLYHDLGTADGAVANLNSEFVDSMSEFLGYT